MSKTILAFGYIPKGKGGKQTTGLATGIFDLHDAVNQLNSEFKVIIAATDIHQKRTKIDYTDIIGWDKKSLVKHSLMYPFRTLFFIIKTISLLRFRKLVDPANMLVKFIFIDYAINLTKPDLLHFHGTSGALLSTGLWNKKIKRVLRIHGINGYDPSIPFYQLHQKIEKYVTGLLFEKVTFVANGICEEWKEKFGNFNCEMIPVLNGFNEGLFKPLKSNESIKKQFDLITFSGVSERKGQGRVIEAIYNLKKENLNLSYLVIGSGEKKYMDTIKKFVSDNKLDVTFIDYLPQEKLVSYLHQSKYFILPSITEGFGKVYIESIGAGVPVIIPQHLPLTKEKNVLNKENSVFISDYSVKSIEEGLRKLFSSEIIYSNIKVSSSVEALQWKNLAKEYLKIYEHTFMSI